MTLPTIPDEYREKAARLVYGLECYGTDLVTTDGREEDIMSIARALVEEREACAKNSQAIEDIASERRRQIETEGWTPEHDDRHDKGEMAIAAACYAAGPEPIFKAEMRCGRDYRPFTTYVPLWPWVHFWWKPKDRRRDLIRAGALIVAEIERVDRTHPTHSAAAPLEAR